MSKVADKTSADADESLDTMYADIANIYLSSLSASLLTYMSKYSELSVKICCTLKFKALNLLSMLLIL